MSARQYLPVVHDEIDAREAAKLGRPKSAAELHAAIADRKARGEAQAEKIAALSAPPRPVNVVSHAASPPGEGVQASRTVGAPAAGVRGGGPSVVGSSPTASVPTLRIPPGAEQWRHVPAGGWVLSRAEKEKVERLLAEAAQREGTEQ